MHYRRWKKHGDVTRGHSRVVNFTPKEYAARYRAKHQDVANAKTRRWLKAHPEYSRNRKLAKYGLDQDEFDKLLTVQGGGCAICGTTEPGGNGWHIDHDHACCDRPGSCGRCVRGLLCPVCNLGMGIFKDDPVRLRKAAEYIEYDQRRPRPRMLRKSG